MRVRHFWHRTTEGTAPGRRFGVVLAVHIQTAAIAALAVGGAAPTHAQPPTRLEIRAEVACSSCLLRYSTVAELGRDGTEPAAIMYGAWAADSKEFYYLPGESMSQVSVFDSTGKLVRRIGRTGQGPGEIATLGELRIGRGDSLWIQDTRQRHFSIFSPGGESFVRTVRQPRGFGSWLLLPNGSVVTGSRGWSANENGRTAFLIDADGATATPIGPARAARADSIRYGLTFASSRRANNFWVAEQYSDTIELWDFGGRVREIVVLPAVVRMGPGRAVAGRPPPRIAEMREDTADRLWLWIERPNPDYKPPPRELRRADLDTLSGTNRNASFWYIVVVDLAARQLAVVGAPEMSPAFPIGDSLFLRPPTSREQTTLLVQRVEIFRPPN